MSETPQDSSAAPAASASPAAPPSAWRRTLWPIVLVGIAFIAIGVWLVSAKLPKWLGGAQADKTAPAAQNTTGDTRKIHATMFYLSDDGGELVAVSQEVVYGATPAEQARRIAEAQLQPAPSGQTSPVPAGTTVRGLYITAKGDAYLDLSHEIITGHTGGSLDEALTVYAIVNALTVNMPDISAVQILVDGREVDTLAGHVDLRHPLARSLKWVRKGQ